MQIQLPELSRHEKRESKRLRKGQSEKTEKWGWGRERERKKASKSSPMAK